MPNKLILFMHCTMTVCLVLGLVIFFRGAYLFLRSAPNTTRGLYFIFLGLGWLFLAPACFFCVFWPVVPSMLLMIAGTALYALRGGLKEET